MKDFEKGLESMRLSYEPGEITDGWDTAPRDVLIPVQPYTPPGQTEVPEGHVINLGDTYDLDSVQ